MLKWFEKMQELHKFFKIVQNIEKNCYLCQRKIHEKQRLNGLAAHFYNRY